MIRKHILVILPAIMFLLCSCSGGNGAQRTTDAEESVTTAASAAGRSADYGTKYRPYAEEDEGGVGLPFIAMTGTDECIYSVVTEMGTDPGWEVTKQLKMYVVDLKSGIQIPLCGKPDCGHKGDRCNAILCRGGKTSILDIEYIQPYDDKIMVIYSMLKESERKYEYHFVGVSPDGSARWDYGGFEMPVPEGYEEMSSQLSTVSKIKIEDGYVYYIQSWRYSTNPDDPDNAEAMYRLWRMSLSDGSFECMYERKKTFSKGSALIIYDLNEGDVRLMIKTENDVEITHIDGKTLAESKQGTEERYGCLITEDGYPMGGCVARNNSGKFLITHSEFDEQSMTYFTKYILYDRNTGEEKIRTEEELWNGEADDILIWKRRNFIDERYIYLHDMRGTFIYDHDFNFIAKTEATLYAGYGRYFQSGVFKITDLEDLKAGKDIRYELGSYDYDNGIYSPNTFVLDKP